MWLWTFQIDLWKETGASKQRYSWNHGFLGKKKRGKKDAGMSSCGESIGALLYFTVWHKSLIIDVLRIKKPMTVLAWQFSCSRVLVALGCFVALVRDPLLLSTHPVGFVPWQWPDPAGGSNQSGNILDQQRRGKINKTPPKFLPYLLKWTVILARGWGVVHFIRFHQKDSIKAPPNPYTLTALLTPGSNDPRAS